MIKKKLDMATYYRKGVYRHFTEDCKCSCSMTARVDVTELVECTRRMGRRFYYTFLYLLAGALNSRDDYKTQYLFATDELVVFDKINPTHYCFFPEKEICTPVYTEYTESYDEFYAACERDTAAAYERGEYVLDEKNHPNYFDASYIPWVSYDSLNIELPDGYLYFMPIINWGRYREENGRLMLPLTVRLNHAIADGYLVARVFVLLEEKLRAFVENNK